MAIFLTEIKDSGPCRVIRVAEGQESKQLSQQGIVPGEVLKIVHRAPFGGDPIAVEVRECLIAIRLSDAKLVEVEKL